MTISTQTELKAQGFCSTDCRLNPNGCVYCGRTGPIIGVRQPGTVKVLSGRRIQAYRECVAVDAKGPLWTVMVGSALADERGRPVTRPAARAAPPPAPASSRGEPK